MKGSTAHNHYTRLRSRSADIVSRARIYGLTHEEMLAIRKEEIHGDDAWKRIPQWVKLLLMEFEKCALDEIHRRDLVWKHYVNGEWQEYESAQSSSEKQCDFYDSIEFSCHLWRDHYENGKVKPFGTLAKGKAWKGEPEEMPQAIKN